MGPTKLIPIGSSELCEAARRFVILEAVLSFGHYQRTHTPGGVEFVPNTPLVRQGRARELQVVIVGVLGGRRLPIDLGGRVL